MKRNVLTMTIALMSTVLMFTGCQNSQTVAPKLSNLELGYFKTNLEFVRFWMNETFSPDTASYTVTVEASRTDSIVITPRLPEDITDVVITINDSVVKANEGYKVDVNMGDNPFTIRVSKGRKNATTYNLLVTQKDLSAVYVSEKVMEGVWRIYDFGAFPGNENFYLVEGDGKALLFDTGMGKGDLASYIKGLTSLPVDIAITHGHGDHFRQVDQFKESTVYIHEKDLGMLPPELVTPRFKTIRGGYVIDIGGGRRFEALELPGHTPGCLIFLDAANKLAAGGDAAGSGDRVHAYNIPFNDLKIYAEALRKIEAKIKDLDGLTILTGHYYQEKTPLTGATGKQFITDMRILTEKVLSGEIVGKTAYTVRNGQVRELRQAYYGLGGLWYNPNN